MTALVFSNAAAAWTAYAILLLSLAAELGTGSRAGTRDRVSDRGTKYFLIATTSVAVLLGVGAAYLLPSTQRILHEERVLQANLGDAYRDFARGRKRLVPFVW